MGSHSLLQGDLPDSGIEPRSPELQADCLLPLQCGTSFFPAWIVGDPHITTLDGVNYTFNGLGDFLLVWTQDRNSSFLLQGRTAQTRSANATNFIGFAAEYRSSSLHPITVSWRWGHSPYKEPLAQGPSSGD